MQKKKDKMGSNAQSGKYEREINEIKNKQKRQEVLLRRRLEQHANKKLDKL